MVEVIGSSPTAPTNKKRHAELRVCSYWWGRKGRVRGINVTLLFFSKLKMPSVVNLPWQILAVGLPLAGNGKASTAPHFHTALFCVSFLIGGGVKGEADKNLNQTRLRPPFFFDFEQTESFSRISP